MHITRSTSIVVISLVVLFLLVWLGWSYFGTRNIEKPKVLSTEVLSGNIKIYTVAPMIQAVVTVTGSQDKAINAGFRLLAGYIFGGNTTREPVAMTAPVAVAQDRSTTIAMTAPVATVKEGGSYRVSFMMPSKFTLATLPKPTNSQIKFIELPSKKYYVWSFSRYAGEARAQRQLALFLKQLQENGITTTHTPILNQYNDPRTIGFMRHNERRIEL